MTQDADTHRGFVAAARADFMALLAMAIVSGLAAGLALALFVLGLAATTGA